MLPSFRVRRILPLESTNLPFKDLTCTPTGNSSFTTGQALKHRTLDEKRYWDGYIQMRKDEYEQMVKTRPEAALRYLDSDDGEVILVCLSMLYITWQY